MTLLYDILSAYPIMGNKPNQLDSRKAKLAMSVMDRNRHYDLYGIHRWHWVAMGEKLGLPEVPMFVDDIVQQTPAVVDRIANRLPGGFPASVFNAISKGMLRAAKRLEAEPDRR
jgi:serine/threonine-protein kinase HipA